MLDLDAIASRRAESLRQESRDWLDAVWSAAFQALSARLTDGEVTELLALCRSAADLTLVTAKLGGAPSEPGRTPFEWIKDEASRAGVPLADFAVRTAGGEG